MQNEWKKEHYIGILWSPISHRWKDILNDVNRGGVEIRSAYRYTPECKDKTSWEQFVIDCYLSHEVIDNPSVNLESKTKKLFKKLEYEHLNMFQKSLCVFTFEVVDPSRATRLITEELASIWKYTAERIEENRTNLVSAGHPYELNIVKDIIRKRFHDDDKLLPYVKGAYAGRKRIMHSPVSYKGCAALHRFLLTYPHKSDNIEL